MFGYLQFISDCDVVVVDVETDCCCWFVEAVDWTVVAVEVDPVEADPVEADPVDVDPVEFDPVDVDPVDVYPVPCVLPAVVEVADDVE